MYRTPLLGVDGQQLNTISHSETIKAFLNVEANTEEQSYIAHGIFSDTLGRALDATGRAGKKQGREDEQVGRNSGP